MKSIILASLLSFLLINTTETKKYLRWDEDFEHMNLQSEWKGSLDHPELTEIVKMGGENKVLKVKYLKDKFGKESRVRYKVSLFSASAYVLEFKLNFGTNFDFRKGGKLPGLCGGSCTTGCKNITADGWSSRFVWKAGNKLHLYIYDQDRDDGGNPGDRYCGTVYDLNFNLSPGNWIKLKKEIKINNPNTYDGSVKIWANDKLIYENLRMRWRGATQNAEINLFYFTTFFGGSTQDWAPVRDSYAYFDDFRVYQP